MWLKVLAEADALNVEPWKDWSPARSIEAMDAAGVRTAISSITVPGIYFWEGFGNQQAPPGAKLKNDVVAMARDANEYGAKMKTDHPGRFGIWASLPLPLVDESLKEIEYALDTLKLDGIGLNTSIGAKYLGDESFTPVFAELNRRKAVVYTHPGAAPCCLYLIPKVGPTTLEYSQDTARTIVSWIESGSAEKFPDLGWIFSHGGGAIWSQRYIGGEIGTSRERFASPEKPPSRLSFLRKYDLRHRRLGELLPDAGAQDADWHVASRPWRRPSLRRADHLRKSAEGAGDRRDAHGPGSGCDPARQHAALHAAAQAYQSARHKPRRHEGIEVHDHPIGHS